MNYMRYKLLIQMTLYSIPQYTLLRFDKTVVPIYDKYNTHFINNYYSMYVQVESVQYYMQFCAYFKCFK